MKLLTSQELVHRWGWENTGSLANMRLQKRGPRPDYYGRIPLYPLYRVVRYERRHPRVIKRKPAG